MERTTRSRACGKVVSRLLLRRVSTFPSGQFLFLFLALFFFLCHGPAFPQLFSLQDRVSMTIGCPEDLLHGRFGDHGDRLRLPTGIVAGGLFMMSYSSFSS